MRTREMTCFVALALSGAAHGCTGAIGDGPNHAGDPMAGAGGSSGAAGKGGAASASTTGGTGGASAGGASAGGAAGAAGASGDVTACVPLAPVPRRIWRLSMDQYSNAVRDLVGLTTPLTFGTSSDGSSQYAFFNDGSLGVGPELAFSMYQGVQQVLDQIAPRITALAGCTTGQAEQACAEAFARRFAERAFRRPLETAELSALLMTYTEGRKQDFGTGIQLVIEAVLLSPSLVYRTELGAPDAVPDATGQIALTPGEIATQLAFMLTDTTPDAALIEAARDGSLGSPDGLSKQVDRLLQTAVVRDNITRIVVRWFNVSQLFIKGKDPSYFGKLSTADQNLALLEQDLLTSVERFVDDVLWKGSGKMDDLLTSKTMFVNRRLATLYGLPFSGAAGDFVGVETPAQEQRAGMLTQPGFIWALSDPTTTSIVKRGKFIHDDVVCQDPTPGPPPGLLESPEVMTALAMYPTELGKSQYRMRTAPCNGCHQQIDPYALVLENFDPIGAFRTTADGLPVNPTSHLQAPLPEGDITGPIAFAQQIVSSKLFDSCGAQKIASYAIGSMIRVHATCEVEQLRAKVNQSDGSVASLFREVALASFVGKRAGGVQ